jgi:hypothetical protein
MLLGKCPPLSSAYHTQVANVERKMAEEEKFERTKRGPSRKKKKKTLKRKRARELRNS